MYKQTTILIFVLILVLTGGVRADLEGYWTFDEGVGDTVSDRSGNGRKGTIFGATWRADGWDGAGWCLDFDGVDDLVELGAFDVVGPGITLAAWVRPDDFEITGSRFITKANEWHEDSHWWMLGPYPRFGEQRLRFRLKTTDELPTTTMISSSGSLVTGQWQHVAATWDGVTMRTYLDGVQTGSEPKGGDAVATDSSVKVAFGSQPSDAFDTDPSHVDRFFDGRIDEVRIYNEALSADEVEDLFNGNLPIPGPSNDKCVDAEPVGEVTDLAFDTTEATFDGPGLCLSSPNIWYVYTASCNGDATISLLGSSFDTMLAVYEGDDCDLSSSHLIACNDDYPPGYTSQITFTAVAGDEYLIEVGGYGTETGEGILNIDCEPAAVEDAPDLGDAPDSTNNYNRNMNAYPSTRARFPTVYDDGGNGPTGPLHLNEQIVAYLGKNVTRETEADTDADEDGVNNIRPTSGSANNDGGDDGVAVPLYLPTCRWTTFDYTVHVIDPGVDLFVNVWFDFNRDGDWDDTVDCAEGPVREWAVQNQFLFDLPIGSNPITTPAFRSWNPTGGSQEIWMRITLSEQPYKGGSHPGVRGNGGSGPRNAYLYGETEDYVFTPDVTSAICEDYNGDGIINTDDLVEFTAQWLDNCPE